MPANFGLRTDVTDVVVPADVARLVHEHLRRAPETIAFMKGTASGSLVTVSTARIVMPSEVVTTDWDVALNDDGRRAFFEWAAGAEVIVEVHSHGRFGGPASLSRTDIRGLQQWVPHVAWRLRPVAYVALVYGSSTFDGVAWNGGDQPGRIGRIVFEDVETWDATGRSLRRWGVSE
jgi:proteasome lid subunit RPN8/RPN11